MGCCCIKKIHEVDDNDENLAESRLVMTDNKHALELKEKGTQKSYAKEMITSRKRRIIRRLNVIYQRWYD